MFIDVIYKSFTIENWPSLVECHELATFRALEWPWTPQRMPAISETVMAKPMTDKNDTIQFMQAVLRDL
jgi:hypothetical protein